MDAGAAIGVAIAAAVVILLLIFISLWICRRIRSRADDSSSFEPTYQPILPQQTQDLRDVSITYQPILTQTTRELADPVRLDRKKGVGFYEGAGSQNPPPKKPPANQ